MGVPTSEVGYTAAMSRREDREVHTRTCGGIIQKKNNEIQILFTFRSKLVTTIIYKLHIIAITIITIITITTITQPFL